MKTFIQFQQDLQEAIPALAPLVPYVLPAAAAGLGAAGMYFAKKQGQGGRSQPVDYGQSGEGAKPRTPNVQRPSGKITAAQAQQRQARLDRKDQVQADQEAAAKRGIERLLGSDTERAAAAAARKQNQILSRQQATRRRMDQAGQNIPPEHRAD